MTDKKPQRSLDTVLVHDEGHAEGAVSPPIYQTSLFTFDSYQAMVDRFRGESDQALYSRVDNPTVSVLLEKIRQLENGEKHWRSRVALPPLAMRCWVWSNPGTV